MTVKLAFEPCVEPHFLADSYGYRPNKSGLDAVGVTRQRCWQYDWVLEFDIKGLFDNIDHELLMKAVKLHTDKKWILLYINRWLKASMQMPDGTTVKRTCGTPQGGVISPVLSNLFLHYVFDVWMTIHHKRKPWCRYADDGIVHCRTEAEAQALLVKLNLRFTECKLELHPTKTKIVYCKDGRRTGDSADTKFKFLGFEFRKRKVKSYNGQILLGFTPAVCKEAKIEINARIRNLGIRNRTDLSLNAIAKWINPLLNGWINYYCKYTKSAMYSIFRNVDQSLKAWAIRKYKKMWYKRTQAGLFIDRLAEKHLKMFAHWRFMHKVV